jgi:hypothetical protein
MVLRPSDSVPNLRAIRASEGCKLEDLGRGIGWIPSISYGKYSDFLLTIRFLIVSRFSWPKRARHFLFAGYNGVICSHIVWNAYQDIRLS